MPPVSFPCMAAAVHLGGVPISAAAVSASASVRECAVDDARSSAAVGGVTPTAAAAAAGATGWPHFSGARGELSSPRCWSADKRKRGLPRGRRAGACQAQAQVDGGHSSPAAAAAAAGGGDEVSDGRREEPERAVGVSTKLGGGGRVSSRREMMLILAGVYLASEAACHVGGSGSTAQAGFLSGSTGLQSVGPPSFGVLSEAAEFMKSLQEENRREKEAQEERIRSSTLIKDLLKRSEENREAHKREIENKYCARGAQWGVGDCAIKGLPSSREQAREEREAVLNALKREGITLD